MCTHRLLQRCSDGYVLQCLRCNEMQIAFGTCILSCDKRHFCILLQTMQEAYAPYINIERGRHKQIRIPTVCTGVTLICSHDDLDRLLTIMTTARMELDYRELFQFNQN